MGVRDDERYDLAAGVMAEVLPTLALRGRVLVVDDDGEVVVGAARKLGLEVVAWYRRALRGHAARAWVEGESFEAVVIRYPVSRDAFEMILHAVVPRLSVGGRVLVFGANDEGIKSAGTSLKTVLLATSRC